MATFTLPTTQAYPINQGYGPTDVAAEPAGHGYAHWHQGVDFGAPCGDSVLAAGAGTVLTAAVADGSSGAYYFTGYGNFILLDHGGGIWTLYGHLMAFNVSIGQGVQQGQTIGQVGSSGNSQGCHLHFGVYVNNGQTDVNPMPYLTGTPATVAAQTSTQATYAQVIYWARQAGIPQSQLATAAAIAMAESGLRLDATNTKNSNGTIDRGLWQINSVHSQFDPTLLLTSGQYNAEAMAVISGGGTSWHPWSTYHMTAAGVEVGDGSPQAAYHAYLADAQAAVADPASQVAPTTDPSSAPDGAFPLAAYAQAPVDTSPQLPAQQAQIVAVAVSASDLLTPSWPNPQGTAILWLAGNYEMPVDSMSVTLPTYLQPGSWSATLHLGQLDAYPGLWDVLEQRQFTQMIAYMGYVRDKRVPYSVDVLEQMFTGLVVTPHLAYKDRQVTLQGPDLSGIFSATSATLSSLSDTQVNQNTADVVRSIVARHNPKGGGLSVAIDTTDIPAGQAAGPDFTQTRQQGVTEWDWLTQMAATLGWMCYMDGSVLRFQKWPADAQAVVLDYAVNGEPATLVDDVQIDYLPHAKREYQIITQAFQTKGKTTLQSDPQGNPDTTDVMLVNLPANTPKKTLDARAKAILQQYVATEMKLTISVAGVVRIAPNQPIALRSDRINQRFLIDSTTGRPRTYYPSAVTYTYTKGRGLSMMITATNRPPAIQQTNSDLAGLGF